MDLVDFDRAIRDQCALALRPDPGGPAGLEDQSKLGPLRELQYHPRREHRRSRNTRGDAGRLEGLHQEAGKDRDASPGAAFLQPEDIAELACHALLLPRTAEDANILSLKSDTEKILGNSLSNFCETKFL